MLAKARGAGEVLAVDEQVAADGQVDRLLEHGSPGVAVEPH